MTDEQTKAFIERLDQFAKANNMTINAVTAAIGKSNSYFRNTYQSGGSIRREIWDMVREKIDPQVNPEWIEKGIGEMRLPVVEDLSAVMIPLLPVSEIGIDVAYVSAGLSHSHGEPITQVYIQYRQKKIDEDSRRVIDYILEKGEFSK